MTLRPNAHDMERFLKYDEEILEKERRIKDQEIEIITLEKMMHEKAKETSDYIGDVEFQQRKLNIAKESEVLHESMLEMQEEISNNLCKESDEDHGIVEMKSGFDVKEHDKDMMELNEASMMGEDLESKRENMKKIYCCARPSF